MRYLKTYKQFEDVSSNASTSGSGDVISSQPSSYPGHISDVVSGSGDVTFIPKNKKKFKKGTARQVSDMRFLGKDKIGGIFPVIKESQGFDLYDSL